ncbi:hypothetical protein D3C72_1089390 [compost metagenome]
MAKTDGEGCGDERVFIAADAQRFQRRNQILVQAVACLPIRFGEAQPLHQCRIAFAGGQERSGKRAPLRGRGMCGPGRQHRLCRRVRCRHIETRCFLRRRDIGAVVLHRIPVAGGVSPQHVALLARYCLDRDGLRLPRCEPVDQGTQR